MFDAKVLSNFETVLYILLPKSYILLNQGVYVYIHKEENKTNIKIAFSFKNNITWLN